MTDPHYNDRIEAHIRAEAYQQGKVEGRQEMRDEILAIVKSCLVVDKSLSKLVEQIEDMK